jgi:hypothetical protein
MNKLLSSLVVLAALAPVTALAAPVAYVTDAGGNLATVNVANGQSTVIGNSGRVLTDIAFNGDNQLYGIDGNTLYRVDRTTAALTSVGSFGTFLNALTFGSDGTLYAAGGAGLYTLSTTTGAATLLGNTGFGSSGDLTFFNNTLYLSANDGTNDALVSLALPGGTGTRVGSLGLSAVYGLSRAGDNVIYANSNNSIYSVDAATGATTFLSSYTYAGASAAYGTSFLFEAGVPEPATWAMMIAGFGLVGGAMRRKRTIVSYA